MKLSTVNSAGFSHEAPEPTRGTRLTGTRSLRVAETFKSRQGEGVLTGVESFFIRTTGCNLRCWFCDTPYASWNPEGETITLESLVEAARESGCSHVVLTGGEPLLPLQSPELCSMLRGAGLHVTIETAGTVDREIQCDLLSLSPKLRSSSPDATQHARWNELHEQRRLPIEVMRRLIARADDVQVKFVVDSPADFDEIQSVVTKLEMPRQSVWLMPQGVTVSELESAAVWLRPWCEQNGFMYGDRMQIHWYGNRRGT